MCWQRVLLLTIKEWVVYQCVVGETFYNENSILSESDLYRKLNESLKRIVYTSNKKQYNS